MNELKPVRLWARGGDEDNGPFEEGSTPDTTGEYYIFNEVWPTLFALASVNNVPFPKLQRITMDWYDDGDGYFDPNHQWDDEGYFVEREEVDAWVASLTAK